MTTVNLHGHLQDKFGTGHELSVHSMDEAIRALACNWDDFAEEFAKDDREYHIVVNQELDYAPEEMLTAPVGAKDVIDIMPVTAGSGGGSMSRKDWAKAIGGAVLIVVGAIFFIPSGGATGVLIGAGIGLLLSGVSALWVPDVATEGYNETSKNTSFRGPQNLVGQGHPVPIGYGRLRIGTVLISATFHSNMEVVGSARSYLNSKTGQYEVIYSQIDDEGEDEGFYELWKLWDGTTLEGRDVSKWIGDPEGYVPGDRIDVGVNEITLPPAPRGTGNSSNKKIIYEEPEILGSDSTTAEFRQEYDSYAYWHAGTERYRVANFTPNIDSNYQPPYYVDWRSDGTYMYIRNPHYKGTYHEPSGQDIQVYQPTTVI